MEVFLLLDKIHGFDYKGISMEVNLLPSARLATFLPPLPAALGFAGVEGSSQVKKAFTRRHNNSSIK